MSSKQCIGKWCLIAIVMLAMTACGAEDAAQSALPTATQQVVVGDEPEPTTSPVTEEPQVVLFEPPDLNSAEVIAPGQFAIDALAGHSAESQLFPGVPYNPDDTVPLNGMPPHLLVTFADPLSAETPFPAPQPQLRVFPVDAYRDMYAPSGNNEVEERINAVASALYRQIDDIPGPIPVLPGTDGAQALKGRMHYVDFEGGSGIAFVAHYTDAIAPVTNDKLHYIFQGLTDDGTQYISAAIPIAAAFLPDSAETVAPGVANEVSADSNAYFKRIDAEISAAADDDFTPSLATLDALMASIQIDMSTPAATSAVLAAPTATATPIPEPTATQPTSPLAGVVWQWQSVKSSSGDLPISKPAVYTLELLDDNVVRLQADCNYANGNFSLDGDTIAINVIETTKSVCASGSMSSQFVQFLQAAQRFVREDDTMQLVLDADNVLNFVASGPVAVAAVNPTATPEVTATTVVTLTATPEPTATQLSTPTRSATATPQATATATPTRTPTPTPTPAPLPEDGDALPQNIGDLAVSMSVSGVASSYAWTVAPWVTYDDSAEPVTTGIPAHIVVSYNGDDAAEALAAGQRLLIIPRGVYQAQWDDNGDSTVSNSLAVLSSWMASQAVTVPQSGIVVLPLVAGENDLAVQPAFLETDLLRGVRFIGRFNDFEIPVTNGELYYVFQGVTRDGQYLISFMYPITTNALPDSPEAMSPADAALYEQSYDDYLQQKRDDLNALDETSWGPTLAQLDALITSLQVTE
ncbi:MAG: META domain-containing protein [Anaerolineae bacterium]|nr:META domain-containing protein [Anaerolineae bacterium]